MSDLTPEQHEAIAHWAAYGQPSEGETTERFVPNEKWLALQHDFVRPERGVWAIRFDQPQTAALLRGFDAEVMEEKWNIWADGPDAEGRASVHFHRSWTGAKIIQVDLQLTASGSDCVGATWEMDPEILKSPTEEWARSTFVEVCRWVLRMPVGED